MKPVRILAILLAGVFVFAGCDTSVNSSIVVADGESRTGGLASVNGDVTVGENCEIGGSSKTVNGSVRIGDGSVVENLASVNGSVRVGERVKVDGTIESVNGGVGVGSGSEVRGTVSTVNGSISLEHAVAKRDVRTVNGDVELTDQTVVKGDVVVEGKFAGTKRKTPIDIVVAQGSVVEGGVLVKRDVPVRVYLRDGGKVLGEIKGAEVIEEGEARASGDAG